MHAPQCAHFNRRGAAAHLQTAAWLWQDPCSTACCTPPGQIEYVPHRLHARSCCKSIVQVGCAVVSATVCTARIQGQAQHKPCTHTLTHTHTQVVPGQAPGGGHHHHHHHHQQQQQQQLQTHQKRKISCKHQWVITPKQCEPTRMHVPQGMAGPAQREPARMHAPGSG